MFSVHYYYLRVIEMITIRFETIVTVVAHRMDWTVLTRRMDSTLHLLAVVSARIRAKKVVEHQSRPGFAIENNNFCAFFFQI